MANSDKFQTAAGSDAHAQKMIGNAEQLRTRYRKIARIILDHLKIKEYQWEQQIPLEEYLNLKDNPNPAMALIEDQMRTLPIMGNSDTKAISFERIKELSRLSDKRKAKHRNTHDVYGLQLWLNNPDDIKEIARQLANPQSSLYRELKDKVHDFENLFAKPKEHGYSALHVDVREGTDNMTAYGEIQIMPIQMMQSYLSTRSTYTTYREIEEYTKKHYGSDEDEWPETERIVMEALRLSIKARYEADLYACDLMDMRDPYHKHQASFSNETDARETANALQPIADELTNKFLNYGSKIDNFMEDIGTIAQPSIDQGLHMAGRDGDRYLDISELLDEQSRIALTNQPEFSLSHRELH